jgi:hypothetical protein
VAWLNRDWKGCGRSVVVCFKVVSQHSPGSELQNSVRRKKEETETRMERRKRKKKGR